MGGSEMPETNVEAGMSSHAVVNTSPHMEAPIMSSNNDEIRPLLDTIDKLRNLNVMEEGIQLPTIVVFGDQSSGKSSVLAQKLMRIQAKMIARCLPDIVEKIDEKLEKSVHELSKLPTVITSSGEALMTFMNIICSAKDCLEKVLVPGDFSDLLNDQIMHGTARFADMLSKLARNLQAPPMDATEFLMDEIKILERCKSVTLPNFVPRPAFLAIRSQYVDAIHAKPVTFIKEVWDYIQDVLSSVITKYSENFPQIQSSIKRAGRNLMRKMKEQSVNRVTEIVEMEKMTDYTCNPEYMTVYTQKIVAQENFVNAARNNLSSYSINANEFVSVGLSHLRKYDANLLRQAFDMKVRIDAYWTIVVRRIVDNLAMYLQFSVNNLVNSEFPKEMEELVKVGGGGEVEKMMEESPSVASKRKKLKNSIKLLKESKEAVAAIVE